MRSLRRHVVPSVADATLAMTATSAQVRGILWPQLGGSYVTWAREMLNDMWPIAW